MKRLLLIPVIASVCALASAQNSGWKRIEASELGLEGKAFDTPNPYHRVDTCVYKGFTPYENEQCRVPAGLTVLFKTDATRIGISFEFGNVIINDPFGSYRGFDLYIRKDGKWTWAATTTFSSTQKDPEAVHGLISNMAEGVKECMLYLPLYSELNSCRICIPEGSTIERMESPFRHRIVFHGSSFTHGISCTRSGMSYPMQFMRRTGMQVIPMGFSGNCKMQPSFAAFLENIDADAFVFDTFSNSAVPTIRERLVTFIDRMVKAHPGKPLIFQRTIYWGRENFDTAAHDQFQGIRDYTDSIMPILCKRYKDVYYIRPDAELHNGEASTADGTHPNDNGYTAWESSIEKPVLRILRKYGIK